MILILHQPGNFGMLKIYRKSYSGRSVGVESLPPGTTLARPLLDMELSQPKPVSGAGIPSEGLACINILIVL